MYQTKSRKALSVILCFAFLLQCGSALAFAAPTEPEFFTIVTDEYDQNGNLVAPYVVDSHGRRVEEDFPVRAAADEG